MGNCTRAHQQARRYTRRMNRIRTLFVVAACVFCGAAQAQWQWKDRAGNTVFSDRAPPLDIPARNIIKQPGNVSRSAPAADVPAATASAAGTAAKDTEPGVVAPKLSTVDKELADRKIQAEAAAAAKIKAEEERVAATKTENCARAKSGKTLMESGVRVSVANAKGERDILDDAGRAAELRRIQATIDANCR